MRYLRWWWNNEDGATEISSKEDSTSHPRGCWPPWPKCMMLRISPCSLRIVSLKLRISNNSSERVHLRLRSDWESTENCRKVKCWIFSKFGKRIKYPSQELSRKKGNAFYELHGLDLDTDKVSFTADQTRKLLKEQVLDKVPPRIRFEKTKNSVT